MNIKLYYWPKSRAFRVRWLLEELGLPYQLEYLNLFEGETNNALYRAVHPLGSLPAIEVDGEPMFESGAICTWLADQMADKKLAPEFHSDKRREYEQWMYFVPAEVEPPIFYYLLHDTLLAPSDQVKAILPWLEQRYIRVLKVLQAKLERQDYLLGNELSTADIMLGSTLAWKPEFLTPFAALETYLARLSVREAYTRAKSS